MLHGIAIANHVLCSICSSWSSVVVGTSASIGQVVLSQMRMPEVLSGLPED